MRQVHRSAHGVEVASLPTSGTGRSGASVMVTRSGCGGSTWSGSDTTTPSGAWSVTDPAPPLGTCTYDAVYAAGSSYTSAKASTSATIALRPAELSLSVVRGTGSAKKFVTVTGNPAAWHTNRSVTLTAQPAGGREVVLATGPIDAAGNQATYQPPRGTVTYRVRYAGDDWYAASVAARTQ